MKKAYLWDNKTLPPTLIGTVERYPASTGALIKCANTKLVSSLTKGIYSPTESRMVTPDEGDVFIAALPFELKAYIGATLED